MSITFTVSGNYQYCATHGLISERRYSCQTCEFDGRSLSCRECAGKGYVAFDCLPFEMNVANSNARTLWNALGLDFHYTGSIKPQLVLNALRIGDPALVVKAGDDTQEPGCARFISFGIHEGQAERYFSDLKAIALEAVRRGVEIVWG